MALDHSNIIAVTTSYLGYGVKFRKVNSKSDKYDRKYTDITVSYSARFYDLIHTYILIKDAKIQRILKEEKLENTKEKLKDFKISLYYSYIDFFNYIRKKLIERLYKELEINEINYFPNDMKIEYWLEKFDVQIQDSSKEYLKSRWTNCKR